jgi:hypothetical protein
VSDMYVCIYLQVGQCELIIDFTNIAIISHPQYNTGILEKCDYWTLVCFGITTEFKF